MIADIGEAAQRRAGLEFDLPNCTWSFLPRWDQELPELRATRCHPDLRARWRLPQDECLQVLVSSATEASIWSWRLLTKQDGEHFASDDVWRPKGLPVQKMKVLHLRAFPAVTWCGVTRGWISAEMRALRTLQLCMIRKGMRLVAQGRGGARRVHNMQGTAGCASPSFAHVLVSQRPWRGSGGGRRAGPIV